MTDQGTDLLVDLSERVLTLTLNRPEKLNALSQDMILTAIEQLKRASTDSAIAVVVITGAGRGFCSGGDVPTIGGTGSEVSYEQRVDRQNSIHEWSRLLAEIPKVTIAAVNGPAAGAGLGLALSCDLCIASSKSKFVTAFAKVGLSGDFGITWQLTQRVGAAKAKELMFLSEHVSAEQALALGIANRVLPEASFARDVRELACRIARGPLVSYRYIKENVNLATTADFATCLRREAFTHLRCVQTQDHREGAAAFVEKREPRFQGK